VKKSFALLGPSSDVSIFTIFSIAAVFVLSRPFSGISGDGRIYIARALADLDPSGIGRDFMFVHDGQSRFTIFTFLADRFVEALGPSAAALSIAILALAVWLAAMMVFTRTLALGRCGWLILIFVAVLPVWYGPYPLMKFGEGAPTPRPFAEAFVLVALAALVQGRLALAAFVLACGSLFHPIMALPGFCLLFAMLCIKDRRWIAVGIATCLAAIAAAALDLPFIHRLAVIIDPDWLSLLRLRNPYLFPTRWSFEAYGLIAVQIVTLVIAADNASARARFVFLAAAGVGILGFLTAAILGDWMPLLFIVQAQTWRWMWLTSVVSVGAFAVCSVELWRNGSAPRLALALLALGWMCWDEPFLACAGAAGSAILYVWGKHRLFAVNPVVVASIFAAAVLFGLAWRALEFRSFLDYYLNSKPPGVSAKFEPFWDIHLLSIPIVIGAAIWVLRARRSSHLSAALLSVIAASAVILFWDDRGSAGKLTYSDRHPPELAAMIAEKPGEVLWIDSDESLYWLGRPNWGSHLQGAGIVFSRPLAMLWRERIQALVDYNLVDKSVLAPRQMLQAITRISRSTIEPFCARADAPAWIVAPLERGTPPPSELAFNIWRPPVRTFKLVQGSDGISWHEIERYAIVACAR
jgi:hypothetical protein